MNTIRPQAVLSYRHSGEPTHPETVVQYRAGVSLYRSIIEASELFKAEFGKHPNFIRLSDQTRRVHGDFVSGIVLAMLTERGVGYEISSNVARNHLQLLFVERPELEAAI